MRSVRRPARADSLYHAGGAARTLALLRRQLGFGGPATVSRLLIWSAPMPACSKGGSRAGVVGIYQSRLGRGKTRRTRRMVCAPSRCGGRQAAIQPSGLRRNVAVRSWASGFGHFSFARSGTQSRPIVCNGVALVFGPVGRGGRLESRLRPDARSQSGSVLESARSSLPDRRFDAVAECCRSS
jgi:hypothetical protein